MESKKKRCLARKKDGSKCQTWAMPNGRCRLHGGKSVGAPITTGRRSKYLRNIKLAERLEDALGDPKLAEQSENLATLEALICSRMEELGVESSAELWKSANKAFDDLQSSIHGGDAAAVKEALNSLSSVLRNGLGHEKRISDVRSLIQEQAAVARVEFARLAQLDQFVSAREIGALTKVLIEIVRDEVPDRKAQARIAQRLVTSLN